MCFVKYVSVKIQKKDKCITNELNEKNYKHLQNTPTDSWSCISLPFFYSTLLYSFLSNLWSKFAESCLETQDITTPKIVPWLCKSLWCSIEKTISNSSLWDFPRPFRFCGESIFAPLFLTAASRMPCILLYLVCVSTHFCCFMLAPAPGVLAHKQNRHGIQWLNPMLPLFDNVRNMYTDHSKSPKQLWECFPMDLSVFSEPIGSSHFLAGHWLLPVPSLMVQPSSVLSSQDVNSFILAYCSVDVCWSFLILSWLCFPLIILPISTHLRKENAFFLSFRVINNL